MGRVKELIENWYDKRRDVILDAEYQEYLDWANNAQRPADCDSSMTEQSL